MMTHDTLTRPNAQIKLITAFLLMLLTEDPQILCGKEILLLSIDQEDQTLSMLALILCFHIGWAVIMATLKMILKGNVLDGNKIIKMLNCKRKMKSVILWLC